MLFIPTIVSARLADPSRFPKNEPLLPPGENIIPNYQGSVNFSAEPAGGAEDSPGATGTDAGQNMTNGSALVSGASPAEAADAEGAGGFSVKWILLFAVLAVILVYGFWRAKFAKKA